MGVRSGLWYTEIGFSPKPTGRLQADKHVAHGQAGYGETISGAIHMAGWVAPGFQQFGADGFRESGVPLCVIAAFDVTGGKTKLLLGKGVGVVAATVDHALDELIAVDRDVLEVVSGIFEGMEEVDGRRRGVETDGIADACVLGGVIAEDDGDTLFGVGLAAERGVTGGQPGEEVHPIGLGDVTLHPAGGQSVGSGADLLLEGHGYSDDATVELGESDVHGRVNGAQAQGALLPIGTAAGADDALNDGNVQVIEELLGPAGGDSGSRSALLVVEVTHGQAMVLTMQSTRGHRPDQPMYSVRVWPPASSSSG